MKILSIAIRNFLTIGEAEIALADRGLVLVQGCNRDDTSASSNGAGKSTIADALCWALYGQTARGETGDAVVNQTAGKDCRVVVQLEDNGLFWQVARNRKHRTGKNSVTLHQSSPTAMDFTGGTDKLTQAEIEKLLGCSYDVFCASIYSGQDVIPDLPGMTDRNLKQIVEEAAGVTVLERAYEEARKRLGTVKSVQVSAQMKRDGAMERVKDAEEAITANRASIDEWDDRRCARLNEAQQNHDKAEWEEAVALKKTKSVRDVISIRLDIDAQRAALAAVASERDMERKLAGEVTVAEREEVSLRSKLTTLKESFKRAKTALDEVDHKLGCPCDECGRPLSADEIAPTKENLKKRALVIKAEHETTLALAQSAIAARKRAQDALDSHRASMTDTSATSAKLAELQTEMGATEALIRDYVKCGETVQGWRKTINGINTEINPYEAHAIRAEKLHDTRSAELAGAEVDLEDATKALAIAIEVAKVFSPAGVRGAILEEVTPYLNDQTAVYLGVLSDGNISATWETLTMNAKGEAKEKFAIQVENATGGGSFGLLSGGEKRKVRLAAALALQDLVATRATKKIELWIGDEVDGALDPAGLERLMTVLQEKARERGSVFVISHSDLKDWFSTMITVVKEGGVSRVEEYVA